MPEGQHIAMCAWLSGTGCHFQVANDGFCRWVIPNCGQLKTLSRPRDKELHTFFFYKHVSERVQTPEYTVISQQSTFFMQTHLLALCCRQKLGLRFLSLSFTPSNSFTIQKNE